MLLATRLSTLVLDDAQWCEARMSGGQYLAFLVAGAVIGVGFLRLYLLYFKPRLSERTRWVWMPASTTPGVLAAYAMGTSLHWPGRSMLASMTIAMVILGFFQVGLRASGMHAFPTGAPSNATKLRRGV